MAPPAEGELVPVGVVSKPHGVKGEVRLHPFNADSPLWGKKQKKRLAEAFLAAPGEGPRPCVVTSARKGPKYVILTLEGVVGREAADALRGHELHIPREALPPLAEDEFYLLDLEGLALERDGERVGEVARVLEYPASICLEVRFPDGVREIPILEPWVQGIDVEAGVIELGPWDDLPVRD